MQKTESFTPYQKFVVAVLTFLQFTVILDFMILSPLGAVLMPALNMNTTQFGLVVSVYAFSAGASGLLASGFADRFDRKKMLLFFYVGFILGTLMCALAPTYEALLAARMITGLFGGVLGSIVYAISTDLFPMSMRGRVMGMLGSAFAASQILGIPFAIFISNHWGWHSAFLLIVGVSIAVGVVIVVRLQPIDGHLKLQTGKKNPFGHVLATVSNPRYLKGFATTALLATGGFMLMPFGSAFSVGNLGIAITDLPLIYLASGICAMITGPLIGRASDKYGALKTFLLGSTLSIIMVLVYTNLGKTPLAVVILVNIVLFVGISARMVSSGAIMSAIPDPANRGAYMSVSSSIQQISGGLASVLAGLIVVKGENDVLQHFDRLGYVVAGATVVTMTMMFYISRLLSRESQGASATAAAPAAQKAG